MTKAKIIFLLSVAGFLSNNNVAWCSKTMSSTSGPVVAIQIQEHLSTTLCAMDTSQNQRQFFTTNSDVSTIESIRCAKYDPYQAKMAKIANIARQRKFALKNSPRISITSMVAGNKTLYITGHCQNLFGNTRNFIAALDIANGTVLWSKFIQSPQLPSLRYLLPISK